LDQILLTFGSLFIYYREIKAKDPANDLGCTAILDSIEKRWAKSDQDVFIAAVILNPFVKTTAFSIHLHFSTRAGVLTIMKRLYQCFFSITETTEEFEENMRRLFSNVDDYFDGSGICADLTQYVTAMNDEAKRNGISPDPLKVYHGLSPIAGSTPPPLFKLACHILSICPNSASCERLFSIFGNTLTKLRNRLGTQTLTSLAELKMHIRDEHVRDGESKQRMKRFFGAKSSAPSAAPASTTGGEPHIPQQPPSTETEMDENMMEIDPELQPPGDSDATNEFNNITELFAKQTGQDDGDGDGRMPSVISIKISELFNFTNKSWIPAQERSASRSLDEELELYELLDLDAPGEEGIDIEIDHTLDSVLHV
jgi:hypothetical protein